MPQTIKLRRSAVQNAIPTTGQLELGELAINTFDGKLFVKKDNGTASIVQIGKSSIAVSSAASISSPLAWNSDNFDQYVATAQSAALTINADSGAPVDGQKIVFRIKDNGTIRTLSWTTGSSKSFRAIGTTLPTATVAGKTLYVGAIFNSADSRWDVVAVAQEV